VFVGDESERENFVREFGPVPRVVAGCELFAGNQSAPWMVATGLGRPTVLERDDGAFRWMAWGW
jgi:hypothetical protein